MRRFVTTCSLVAAVSVLTGSSSAEERRFQLLGAGDGQFIFAGSPPMPIGFTFTAQGVGSHLGPWTNSGTVLVVGEDPDGNLLVSGTVRFVAVTGDELDGDIAGSLDSGTGVGNAEFCWDGGTGRFADATGKAGFTVQQGPANSLGQFEFVFDAAGKIDY